MTHGPAHIEDLLRASGVRPSRALGQNFVADANTVRRIVRLAGIGEGSPVVEVGAGLGSLTLALAEAGALVVAVEIDRRLAGILRAEVEPAGVRVVEADACALDWASLLAGSEVPPHQPWTMVANLPYNVAIPIVVRVLETAPTVTSMLVMVQREVGERLAAGPGDDSYGAVSVKVAYWAKAAVVGRVPATVFVPRPRVESVLVRLERRPDDPPDRRRSGPGSPPYDRLFTVVRAGFAHRRKMLRRSLDGVVALQAFEWAGVDPTSRAEEIDLERWWRLAGSPPPTPSDAAGQRDRGGER